MRTASLVMIVAVLISSGSCGPEPPAGGAGGPAATPSEPEAGPDAIRTQVALIWKTPAGGNVLPAGGALAAVVRNLTDRPVAGDLSMVSSGLDGRLVERTLGMFSLSGKQQQSVSIPLLDLPIQTEAADSFVALQASFTGDDGLLVRIPSIPLYYHFRAAFSEVVLRTGHEVAIDPQGGVLTSDPMAVEGRVLDAAGRMATVVNLGQPPAAGDDDQAGMGLSGARAFPAVPEMTPPPDGPVEQAADIPAGTLAATATVNLCSTWRVFYIDSARGEDVWPTTGWQDVPAQYARVLIVSDPGNALYWQGNLDVTGCTTVTTLPGGNYRILQQTTGTRRGNVTINTYFMSGGVEYFDELSAAFTVPASGTVSRTLHPTYNDDAVQAAAVMGQVLATHNFNGGMGIKDGTYKVRTNQGCTDLNPPTDSCFSRDEDIVYIGTTVIAGISSAHWKFMTAHEVGHMVSYRAMGRPLVSLTDESATQPSCRCDHYGPEWGNGTHCLQSREQIGGAMNEGFGHAFAARTFNFTQYAEGTFVYYKPLRNDSGSITYPPLGTSSFNVKKWMVNHCSAAGKGVEWDWMTFYFNVASTSSASATTFANLFSIYNRACTGSPTTKCNGQTVAWSQLVSAAQTQYGSGSAAYTRFRDTGIAHGVNF